jgi:hypothetical protein
MSNEEAAYYVRDVTTNTIQLTASSGGPALGLNTTTPRWRLPAGIEVREIKGPRAVSATFPLKVDPNWAAAMRNAKTLLFSTVTCDYFVRKEYQYVPITGATNESSSLIVKVKGETH